MQGYAGKVVKLELTPVWSCFTIGENGDFTAAAEGAIPDASITFMPVAALRQVVGDKPFDSGVIKLEGDAELAVEISQVLRQLQWEYEEDLSALIGDIPAHELVGLARSVIAEGRRQMLSLAGMFAEYWQEEQPLIAGKRVLERFAKEVDELRDATERLGKRMENMGRRI